jgi:hypothetical protein
MFKNVGFQFAYFKRILEREKKRKLADSDNEEDEEDEPEEQVSVLPKVTIICNVHIFNLCYF